jgi:hypothetical protein
MKPVSPTDKPRFPRTEFFYHSDLSRWRGFWSPSGNDGDSEQRKFYNFTREFLLESARERTKEMIVFAFVVLTAAWPVGYMIFSVVKLLLKGQPLDRY